MVAAHLGIERHVVIKFDLRDIGGSALTADIAVPKSGIGGPGAGTGKTTEGSSPALNIKTPIPVTYVPARNTIFLSFALAFAEVLGAGDIFIGANAIDYSGYPDCRPEYLKAFEQMANLATKASVEGKITFHIRAPLLYLSKGEIIRRGNDLGLDYSLTWSCYDPQKNLKAPPLKRNRKGTSHASRVSRHGLVPCGRCDSCLFRGKGFTEAGIPDPLIQP